MLIICWIMPQMVEIMSTAIMFHLQPYLAAKAHGDAMGAMMQQINVLKNISIMGGLLLIAGFGSGAWSVDGGL